MNKKSITNIRYQLIFTLLIAGALLLPQAGFGASTGTTNLVRQFGSGYSSAGGDYISASIANGGLNLPYYYYIEVPAGLNRLRVSIYDADVGRGAANDWLSGTWNTSCTYTLYDPSGANRGSITGSATQGTNDGWQNIINTTNNLIAGHWQLIVNMTSAVTTGDDLNGFGIRADNNDDTSGGTEVNVYAHSFIPVGRVGTGSSTNTFHPFITSGCNAHWNDWDGDNLSIQTYRTRTGENTGSFNGSGATAWLNNTVPNFDTDLISNDSGIWTWTGTYTDTGAGGNFGVFYVGNYNAVNPPPISQPQPNTFRIYLPKDGGGEPNKPVFSQKISFVSGPNPPVANQTTRVRVELIIFNPAAQAITFSAANPVTSFVPGGGVVYAGNPVASPVSSTVTAPAIGGTGTVTWNPGTVAGNNTYATLYYEINVTPPNSNRLPVTGSPAGNGSTARYVDETGHQATGTYTYGPLCELAVTPGVTNIPTWVAISCFEADINAGQPTIEWHTSAENGTVGFYLWRQDAESKEFRLVNPDLLPAAVNAMTGGVYRLVDPNVQYNEKAVYRLEEITFRGDSQIYGPFSVTFDGKPTDPRPSDNIYSRSSKEIPTHINGFQRAVFTASEYEKSRLQSRSKALRTTPALLAASGGGAGRARIAVKNRGLFFIDAASIANSLDKPQSQVEGLIASHRLSLSNLGEPVAWLGAADNGGIYFYGEKLQSPYSDLNVYWLEPGLGTAFAAVSGGNTAPAPAGQTFNTSSHYEENRYPLTSLFYSADDDFWFWDFVQGGGEVKVFPMWVSSPATSGTAILTVNLHGVTDTAAASEHHARFYLNDNLIGETQWDGLVAHTCQFLVNQSILRDGKNTFVVSGLLDGGVKYSYFYLNSLALSYQQYYQVANNTLWCHGGANQTISVIGFTDAQVMVLDVTQPRLPKLVTTSGIDAAGRLSFIPELPTNLYLLTGLSAVNRPFSINAASSADLKDDKLRAEYLLISPREFADESRQLAEYRRSQGLEAAVVTLEDIYDSFNWGLASPLAIKDFLSYNRETWNPDGLKYVVLVGKGTFDYKNYLGAVDNLVPPLLAGTPDGLFASDNLYGDLENGDGVPEIAIGRLPVVSVEELRVLINKIKTYGSSGGEWTNKALLIADNNDSGGDFFATSESLGNQLKGYALERFTLTGEGNASLTRSEIIAGFNSGAALVNFVGHAGLNQLTEENIFNIADLPFLWNGDRLPIMVFVTCAAGRFDIPGFVSLGEALVLKDFAGIVAALAPSSASFNSQAGLLAEEFYKAAFSAKEKDLGSAWLAAAKNFISQGGKPFILNMFNLLGDPAVVFK